MIGPGDTGSVITGAQNTPRRSLGQLGDGRYAGRDRRSHPLQSRAPVRRRPRAGRLICARIPPSVGGIKIVVSLVLRAGRHLGWLPWEARDGNGREPGRQRRRRRSHAVPNSAASWPPSQQCRLAPLLQVLRDDPAAAALAGSPTVENSPGRPCRPLPGSPGRFRSRRVPQPHRGAGTGLAPGSGTRRIRES